MSNDFYSPDGAPATGSSGSSAVIRSEFTRLQASFDKMPSLTSTGGRLVRVNPGSTALEAMTLTAGAILYGGGNNEVVQGNNFAWNAANNTLSVLGEIYATQAFRSTGTAVRHVGNSVVLDQSVTTGRLRAYGNSPSNRGSLELHVQASDGTNDIAAISIDTSGNTTLNNLNATFLGATNINTTGGIGAGGSVTSGTFFDMRSAHTGVVRLRTAGGSNELVQLGLIINGNYTAMEFGYGSVSGGGGSIDTGPAYARLEMHGVDVMNVVNNGTTIFSNANGISVAGPINANQVGLTNLNATGAISATGNVSAGNVNVTGALRGTSAMMSPINSFITGNIAANNTSAYFDGPNINVGTTGTWWVSGGILGSDTSSAPELRAKLWDGTTVISAGTILISAANQPRGIALSGFITNPAGNLRISMRDPLTTNGLIVSNASLEGRDSYISAIRIG